MLDPALRCGGSARADVIEAQVWEAVLRVLEQPELIGAEVARKERDADAARGQIGRQLGLIDAGLAKCDREGQRWADAYAAEVISLAELKGYRAEIEARRQSLLREQAEGKRQLDAIGVAVQHVEALIGYCARVHQRLQTFDDTEKRLALQALNIRASWTPGQRVAIQGSIPLGDIVDNPPRSFFRPTRSARRRSRLHWTSSAPNT